MAILSGLFLQIMLVHRHAHTEVADRKNVGPAQSKYQEHVSRPHADSFHLREVFDDLVV